MVVWELGGGLGHLVPLSPIVKQLAERGHQLFLAVRDLSRVESLFGGLGVRYLPTPVKLVAPAKRIEPPRTFAHILDNNGFRDPDELGAMALAWRNLYDFVQPNLIIFDHSPLALLVSRTIETRRVVIGTGFCCPPDVYPLPDFRPWLGDSTEALRRDEDQVLMLANGLLEGFGVRPLERLSQLYREVDATILATFPELDHYANRQEGEYFGVWSNPAGRAPHWPEASGKRILAYLKAFPALPSLLAALKQLAQPTVVYLENCGAQLIERFQSPTLRFTTEMLNLALAGSQCDLAVLHGGHGATAEILLAGKPLLLIPLHLEQSLNAAAVKRLGAGLEADRTKAESIVLGLRAVCENGQYALAARRFAHRYSKCDSQTRLRRVVQRIEDTRGLTQR